MPPELPATSVIAEVVDKYADDLVALRRDLHAHPELSWAEERTSDAVVTALEGAGWTVQPPRGRRGARRDRPRAAGWSRCAPTSTRCRSTT